MPKAKKQSITPANARDDAPVIESVRDRLSALDMVAVDLRGASEALFCCSLQLGDQAEAGEGIAYIANRLNEHTRRLREQVDALANVAYGRAPDDDGMAAAKGGA